MGGVEVVTTALRLEARRPVSGDAVAKAAWALESAQWRKLPRQLSVDPPALDQCTHRSHLDFAQYPVAEVLIL
jgi:hypothetical protein